MVIPAAANLLTLLESLWLAQQTKQLPIERLDPVTRAKVLAALTGLIILMFGMMFLAWLGSRWARHYADRKPILFEDRNKRQSWSEDDWASKRLSPTDAANDEDIP